MEIMEVWVEPEYRRLGLATLLLLQLCLVAKSVGARSVSLCDLSGMSEPRNLYSRIGMTVADEQDRRFGRIEPMIDKLRRMLTRSKSRINNFDEPISEWRLVKIEGERLTVAQCQEELKAIPAKWDYTEETKGMNQAKKVAVTKNSSFTLQFYRTKCLEVYIKFVASEAV